MKQEIDTSWLMDSHPCDPPRAAGSSEPACWPMIPDDHDAAIFEGRAYQLRDVAQWLGLNGQPDLSRRVRDLAAEVYEIAIEKRKANIPLCVSERTSRD